MSDVKLSIVLASKMHDIQFAVHAGNEDEALFALKSLRLIVDRLVPKDIWVTDAELDQIHELIEIPTGRK